MLIDKTYCSCYCTLLSYINNYQLPLTKQATAKGAARVHNIDALIALSAQVTSLTNIIKAMSTAPTTAI